MNDNIKCRHGVCYKRLDKETEDIMIMHWNENKQIYQNKYISTLTNLRKFGQFKIAKIEVPKVKTPEHLIKKYYTQLTMELE